MPRSVSSREVRLHVQDELDSHSVSREMSRVTVKKKRVEKHTASGLSVAYIIIYVTDNAVL